MALDILSYLLGKKSAQGGGGGVTVEPLSVNENGTYTAPSGKAYSPVTVEVGPAEPVSLSDVNFIDYDGTILYSYTAAEFAQLDALPPNPDRTSEGLTAQGWNWTLAGAKAYVADYKLLWIGQLYITTDGKTHIHIELFKGRTSPYCGFGLNGTAVIDWGDGQTDTVTGTNAGTLINTQHNYAAPGDYVIKIDVTDGTARAINVGSSTSLLNAASTVYAGNGAYTRAIKHVRFGNGFESSSGGLNIISGLKTITFPRTFFFPNGSSGLSLCGSLQAVVYPNGVSAGMDNRTCASLTAVAMPETATGNTSISVPYCAKLANVAISSGVTTVQGFTQCYGLTELYIPSSATSISANTFKDCLGLAELHFTPTAPPTVDNSNAFSNIAPDIKIFVPAGRLSAYQSATNYPDPAVYTYVEE